MPQSLGLVIVGMAFSTKERHLRLGPDVRPRLDAHLATVARAAGCECYCAGGVADHVHPAIALTPNSPARIQL